MKSLIANRKLVIILHLLYGWISNIFWIVMDLLPQFARNVFFGVVFDKFGRNSMIDYKCYFRYPWKVSVGKNVAINRGCEFYSSMLTEGGRIVLEDNVVMGPGVVVFAAGHDYSSLDLPDTSAPVVIGRYAWIGGKALVLPGVIIGEGVVVGAGSVVSRNISEYSVAVGNPAKVVKKRGLMPGIGDSVVGGASDVG